MNLLPEWRRLLKHAWSIRLILLAGFFSGLEIALPVIDQWIIIPRGLFAAMSGVTTMVAAVARLVVQQKLSVQPKEDQDADQ